MPERIPQSVARRVVLKLYLTSDHIAAAAGKTLAIVLSKNGAAFANPSGGATNATEIGSGWYYVDLSTTDTGTAGPLIVRGTSASCDDSEERFLVADAHNAGFDGVPSAAAGANAGLPVLSSAASTLAYTISTATNLTNAPSAGDLTATMKASIGTAVAASAVASVTAGVTLAAVTHTGAVIPRVTLADTLTTYTGNTPQTGDVYALANGTSGFVAIKGNTASIVAKLPANAIADETLVIAATGSILTTLGTPSGASIAADIQTRSTYAGADTSGTTSLLARLSATRSGYLDNLSAGAVGLEATGQAVKAKTDLIPDIAITGTASGTPTATSIVGAAGLSATDNLYTHMFLVFTSGTLRGVGMEVTAYVGSTRTFATDAFPVAATAGDTFILVGRRDT